MRNILPWCLGIFLCGCSAEKGTEIWIGQTHDRDASKRLEAVRALAERKSEALVPVFSKLLKDDNAAVRRAAVQALGGMGAPARPAVPILRTLLQDENSGVRKVTVLALKRIVPEEATK